MIIWLNGPFGAGKTTVTKLLLEDASFAVFDTEEVGYMLRHALSTHLPVHDFQDWVPWRRLVVHALAEVSRELECHLVVPQTVLVQQYWREIADGLTQRGVEYRAYTLHVDVDEHARRIDGDAVEISEAVWRHERRVDYDRARSWLEQATTLIDTTNRTPIEVARLVHDSAR